MGTFCENFRFFEEVLRTKTVSQTFIVMDRRLAIRSCELIHEELQIDHTRTHSSLLWNFQASQGNFADSRLERDLLFSKFHEN